MLKISNSSVSLLALLIGLSIPLSAAGGDETKDTLSATLGVKPSFAEDLSYVQNFFIPGLKSNPPMLDVERLKKEIISVSIANLKSPGTPEILAKIDALHSLMDDESQKNLSDETLQLFLFKVYSGQILKTSIFINAEKATNLLANAHNQMWGWAFWERAKSNPNHATGSISQDHLKAANLECADAIKYVSTQLGYEVQSTENLCNSILKVLSGSKPNEPKKSSAENFALNQMVAQINSFHKRWKIARYARPLIDFVSLIGSKSSDPRLQSACNLFLTTAAKLENPHAKMVLGKRAFTLAKVAFEKNNHDDSMKFLRIAIQYDHIKAIGVYGYQLFNQGKHKEAIEYFAKAAAKGDITALYNLGITHVRMGNLEEAKKCFLTLALKNHLKGMSNLASIFYDERNMEEAKRWLLKATELGDATSMYNLGCVYSEEGNTEQEQKWFLAAAKKGDPSAMYNLARSYAQGNAYQEAHDWFLESALANSDSAMFQLGLLYIKTKNMQDGSFWMHKAASLGNKYAIETLELAEKLFQERELSDTDSSESSDVHAEPQEKPEEDPLDQKIEKIFENMEPEKPVLSNRQDAMLTPQSDIIPASPDENAILPETVEKTEMPSMKKEEISVSRPDNDKEVRNPKTRRAMLKALWQEKQFTDTNANQGKLVLSDKAKTISNAILSGNSDHIQREHLEILFNDPFFSNQVRVLQTKSGFAILAHHRQKNQHINTGMHKKHGQEKFTGHIHPETLKSVKGILMLFGI